MSCEPQKTLFPLYTAEDKIFDEQLLGKWLFVDPDDHEAKNDKMGLRFDRSGDSPSYAVLLSGTKEKDEIGLASVARMVQLGDFRFLELSAPKDDDSRLKFYPYPVATAHVFARIRMDQKTLRLDFLNDDWIRKQMKTGKPALATLETDDNLLVTATTAELRKFALAHAEDAEAFSDHYEFVRAK